jgi:hypothetical protein
MLPVFRQISKLQNMKRGPEIHQKVSAVYYFAPREHCYFSRLPIDRQTGGVSNHPVLTNAPLFEPTPMGKPSAVGQMVLQKSASRRPTEALPSEARARFNALQLAATRPRSRSFFV